MFDWQVANQARSVDPIGALPRLLEEQSVCRTVQQTKRLPMQPTLGVQERLPGRKRQALGRSTVRGAQHQEAQQLAAIGHEEVPKRAASMTLDVLIFCVRSAFVKRGYIDVIL